jgi:two-component system sensor histidine kinase GlrK
VQKRYPKSFVRLILIGFALVALPLTLAIGYAAVTIQGLAIQSEQAVQRASAAARASRQLAESLIGMERVLRQYLVLREPSLAEDYQRLRADFRQVLGEMTALQLDAESDRRLAALLAREQGLNVAIAALPTGTAQVDDLVESFHDIANDTLPLIEAGRAVADSEVEGLQRAANHARDALMLPLIAALALALLIGLWFQRLVAAQIRQFDQAIRAIGRGEYAQRIAVSGPDDLAFLGERLDWLRGRLGELEEQKGRFLRHVSHDLKTPLTAIREGAQLMADGVPGTLTDKQRSIVDIMMHNALRLQTLIEELLNYQQASLAADHLDMQPVALDALVDQVLHAHRLAAQARELRFQKVLPQVQITGDPEKLRVVVDNLITNAIKFSPREGVIRVLLGSEDGQAVLDVADDGPGVPESEREKIFDAFFRGTRTRNGVEGSGLGLAIAREYVVAHHGRIEVLSETGEGGHFRVTLPKVKIERKL